MPTATATEDKRLQKLIDQELEARHQSAQELIEKGQHQQLVIERARTDLKDPAVLREIRYSVRIHRWGYDLPDQEAKADATDLGKALAHAEELFQRQDKIGKDGCTWSYSVWAHLAGQDFAIPPKLWIKKSTLQPEFLKWLKDKHLNV